ncbi:MAG: hypothetical protein Q4A01_10830 [Coriobacteriales bacterium]|nr:hypothetical protein [Coriobacteriales bacterium]
MAPDLYKRSSFGRKAATAVVSGLLVLGMTPVVPIAQAFASDTVVVEDSTTVTETQSTNEQVVTNDNLVVEGTDGVQTDDLQLETQAVKGAKLDEAHVVFDVRTLTYNGKEQKPAITIVSKDDEVIPSDCYKVTYPTDCTNAKDNLEVSIEAVKNNEQEITGSTKSDFSIAPAEVTKDMVTLSADIAYANDKEQKPTVTVKDPFTGKTLVEGTDYTVAWGEGDYKAVGTYKITVTGLKNFTGTVTKDYQIKNMPAAVTVTGTAHVQKDGDKTGTATENGVMLGTTGQSKRIEAMTIKLSTKTDDLGIEYRSHVQGIGWEKASAKDGEASGTKGQAKRLEGMQVALTGKQAEDYDVFYRVHAQTYGWLGWAKNGEPAGTAGQSKRLEAIEVCVLPKGLTPKDYDATEAAFNGRATGVAHVQTFGTLPATTGIIGTTGKAKRMESIRLTVPNQPYEGGIEYQTHVQKYGWEDKWAADGALSGTEGEGKRLEAVRVRLTGELSNHFSVWYRVHCQTYGWSGWAKDGAEAGTSGLARRTEAIEVVILPKDAAAPGSTENAMRTA